jgi:ABC-2 type transport system permease protein
MRFLPILTQIFLWTAVYASAGDSIGGYTRNDVVAYYLLTMLGRAFSSMPGLASGIAEQVRSGEIKKFLIQPIDLLNYLLLARVAHKVVYYAVAAAPFALVFWLCGNYFPPWPPAEAWGAFLLSLVLGFFLGFYLEATLGMIGFWFLEVSSLLFVYMLANFFFSGHMFPLDFLIDSTPGWFGWLVWLQPLQFLAYFPAAVYLGKITGPELWMGLAVQVGWAVFFYLAARWMMHRGFRRYSGFGG